MAMSPFDPFALARWDPWSEMTSLRDAMNRLMESSFVRPNMALSGSGVDLPLDLTETDGEYRIEAHVPGVKPEDVQVSVHDNVVTLQGERREQQERKDGGRRIYTEHRYGRFSRSFSLPTAVDAERCRADFHEGVLTLTLPKMEAARSRRIPVSAGGAVAAPQSGDTGESTGAGTSRTASARSKAGSSARASSSSASGRRSGRRASAATESLPGEGGGPAVHREPVNMPEENQTRQRARR